MKNVLKTVPRKYYLIVVVLTALLAGSYYNFQAYQPKKLKKIEEVKGVSTNDLSDFPYPKNAEQIGFNQTSDTRQATFQTTKTPEEIQDFYHNVYEEKDWETESEINNQGVMISKYKKDRRLVTIISTRPQDSEYTIVSVEISGR